MGSEAHQYGISAIVPHFAGKPVVESQNVGWFLRISVELDTFAICLALIKSAFTIAVLNLSNRDTGQRFWPEIKR